MVRILIKSQMEYSWSKEVGKQSPELQTNTFVLREVIGLTSGSDDFEKWWLGEVVTLWSGGLSEVVASWSGLT